MERVVLPEPMDVRAPDGSEVRILAQASRGSMAHFLLNEGETSIAKRHRTIEELWFFVSGSGEMCIGDEVCAVEAGVSILIPPDTRFQFRSVDGGPLAAVAVTMPPWPGEEEALDAEPYWDR
ncbi:MAG: cupin domain-containing protein [Actinomycetota bacterium]